MKLATKAPFLLFLPVLLVWGAEQYQKPPKAVLDILNSPATPALTLNPTHTYAMQGRPVRYPPIAELAQPMRRIAGMRINPATNGLHNVTFNSSLTLRKIPEGTEIKIALPPNPKLSGARWSPDGKHFVFTNTTDNAIELWIGDAATGHTHNIEGLHINDVMGTAGAGGRGGGATGGTVQWLADNRTLLVHAVDPNRGPEPPEPLVPTGPHVQESLGGGRGRCDSRRHAAERRTMRTCSNTYATAQLTQVDSVTGKADAHRQARHHPNQRGLRRMANISW